MVEDNPSGSRVDSQIAPTKYAAKYQNLGQPIHLIGTEFSRQSCTVIGFEAKTKP